jgi:hypothetical protein
MNTAAAARKLPISRSIISRISSRLISEAVRARGSGRQVAEAVGSSSHLPPRWSKPDSNLYGAFSVKWLFWVLLRVLCSEVCPGKASQNI